MALAGLENIMASWFGFTGDYTLIAIMILIFFLLAFLLVGLDFRFALLFCLPLAAVFSAEGWFALWFSVLFWFIAVGLGGFIIWTMFSDR